SACSSPLAIGSDNASFAEIRARSVHGDGFRHELAIVGIEEPGLANYMTKRGDVMDEIVPVHAAKTHLSQLLARVEAGEVITIARGRTPVAKLVPIAPKAKREFGAMRGKIAVGSEFFEPLPEDELDRWGQ